MNNKINRAMALMLALQMAASTASPVMAQVSARGPMNVVTSTTTPLTTAKSKEDLEDVMDYLKKEVTERANEIKKIIDTKEGEDKESYKKLEIIIRGYKENFEDQDGSDLISLINRFEKNIKNYKVEIGKHTPRDDEKEKESKKDLVGRINKRIEKLKAVSGKEEVSRYISRYEEVDETESREYLLDALVKGDKLVKEFYIRNQAKEENSESDEDSIMDYLKKEVTERANEIKKILDSKEGEDKESYKKLEIIIRGYKETFEDQDESDLISLINRFEKNIKNYKVEIGKHTPRDDEKEKESKKDLAGRINKRIEKLKAVSGKEEVSRYISRYEEVDETESREYLLDALVKGDKLVKEFYIRNQAKEENSESKEEVEKKNSNKDKEVEDVQDVNEEGVLKEGQTLTLKEKYDEGKNSIYIFESTLPEDFELEFEGVTYGIYNEKVEGEYILDKIKDRQYKLIGPKEHLGGIYFINIKDKNGKYKLPEKRMYIEGVEGIYLHQWKNNKTIINSPYFINSLSSDFEYHNGKIANGDPKQIDLLNKNIRLILVTTAGSSAFQIYTPQDGKGNVKGSLNNVFYDLKGTINSEYTAGSYVLKNSAYTNLKFIDDIINMRDLEGNGPAKSVKIYYYGTEIPTEISYPFSEYKPSDPNPAVILGRYRLPEKTIQLKIKLNTTEDKVLEVTDNNTAVAGNPAYASYMAEGFKEYRGKTLEEIEKIVIEDRDKDIKAQATADVKKAVKSAIIDALKGNNKKRATYSEIKKNLKTLINESYETLLEIEQGAFKDSNVNEFKTAYQKALETFGNNNDDASLPKVYDSLNSTKNALQRKDKDNKLLEAAVQNARTKKAEDYEEWSYAFLEKAIKECEEELNKHLNPTQIQDKIKKLQDIEKSLVPKLKGERQYFKVKGRIAESGLSSDSMANDAMSKEIYIEQVAGKTIYHLLFKPMEVMGVKAEIQNLKHFEDNQFKETSVRLSKSPGYTKVISFIRDAQDEKEFKIQTGAYMTSANIDYRDADLKLENKKETITESQLKDAIKSEIPNLSITDGKDSKIKTDKNIGDNIEDKKAIEAGVYKIPFEWKRDGSEEEAMGKEAFSSITAKVDGEKATITINTRELEIKNNNGVLKGHLLGLFIKDGSSKSDNETDKSKALKGEIETTKSDFKTITSPTSKIKKYPTKFTFTVPKEVLTKKYEVNVRVIVDIMDMLAKGEPGSGKGSKSAKLVLNPNSESLKPVVDSGESSTEISITKDDLRKEYYKSYALSERDYEPSSWNIFKEKYDRAADILIENKNFTQDEIDRAKEELVKARNGLKRLSNSSSTNADGRVINGTNSNMYTMRVTALEADRNETSMAANAIVNPVTIREENNRLYADVKMQSINYRGFEGEVQELFSFSGNSRYGSRIPARKSGNIFTFEVPREVLDRNTEVWLEVNVDMMDALAGGGYGSGNRVFRMVFDPSNKSQVSSNYNPNFNSRFSIKDELDREIRNGLNYNSRDYEDRSWRDFQYSLDRARDVVRDSRASDRDISRALDDLIRAKRNLIKNNTTKSVETKNSLESKKINENVKTYEVGVEVLRADGNGTSMARDGVHKIARVEEKDGKFKYYVSFKPIEKSFKGRTLTGNITKLFYYDGGKYEATNEGGGVWSFTLNSKIEDVKIAVWVDAMDELRGGRPGAGEQDAILRFNWSSAKDITPKKNEEKKVINKSGNLYDIQNHWARVAIEFGLSKGYFEGVGDNKFEPDRGMTRGEFVTVLGRIQKIDKNRYQNSKFSDVKQGEFYAPYVNWASETGIVNGVGNERFNPNDVMTREQMAVIMARYLKVAGIKVQNGGNSEFKDSSKISSWAKDSVEELAKAKIVNGMEDGTFSPKTPFTRAQVAQVLYNIYK
ncbi:MAG: S-layer homology domain-containing protein [Peptoniphilus sp.]|uniref:S-layer homology domain-containing protein n=1 Tax=Peptoniphilus sp. TaxID=1971214 RepID=UPI002A76624C|nr:S-layer homology domain-containing protein [Peptoniphilus sp.]MDY2986089.1 S-layer homology domain-containing protein [Peptoniphilus sp.]